MDASHSPSALLLAALLAVGGVGESARAAEPPSPARLSLKEQATRLTQVASQLRAAEENIHFVETQFTERPELNEEEARLRRFSDGEIQYLLGDWEAASVLFYDLVSDAKFRQGPRYPDALFYLADSLFQQKNDIGARLYLKELLALPDTGRHREGLTRYLEVAGRLNQFDGIDEMLEKVRRGAGGKIPEELEYVSARWFFKRKDLPDAERRARARESFTALASRPTGRFQRQSTYYLGVLAVQEGHLEGALESFRALIGEVPPEDTEGQRLKELANLSLGRLLYELGRYDEALDRYSEIPRESESFVESLYEIAWVHVKQGSTGSQAEKAKNAIDILLLMAPDSPLAPDARILQGHLLLKLRRYEDATATYSGVVGTYAPVRDQLDALLKANQDPVTYFDKLLARNERHLDVAALLPPLALKTATTQKEVESAVRMVKDLDTSKQGVDEAEALTERILQALDTRKLEVFPELQEGYLKAEAADSALARVEQLLVQVESDVVDERVSPEERARLAEVRREREALQVRFNGLPTNPEELTQRRERMQERVDALDGEAYKLGYELQSLNAISTAVRKFADDTRAQRTNTPEEEQAFLARVQAEQETLAALQTELEQLRARLADTRRSADAAVAGEEHIREEFREVLGREHAQLAVLEAGLPQDAAAVLRQAHEVRERAQALHTRVARARMVLRAQVEKRGHVIREKVLAEQQLLRGYGQEVDSASGNARNLVGRIAYESIQRVRQQFYNVVLKADVGLVDVAFTRKQDQTEEIQKLAAQKDRELNSLEEDFKEVLQDVD